MPWADWVFLKSPGLLIVCKPVPVGNESVSSYCRMGKLSAGNRLSFWSVQVRPSSHFAMQMSKMVDSNGLMTHTFHSAPILRAPQGGDEKREDQAQFRRTTAQFSVLNTIREQSLVAAVGIGSAHFQTLKSPLNNYAHVSCSCALYA